MFKDQVIVITGAARGLGLGMAKRFARDGAHVVITDIDQTAGERSAQQLRSEGASVQFAPLDVRDPAQSNALVERLVDEQGHLDVWVNNAGVAYKGPAETLPLNEWDQSIAVMLSGAFYCAQAAGRQMLAQGRGVIVNVASVGGYKYIEGRVAYSVPKAGVMMLTQALGVEWAKRGVRVVGIAPGVVMTELVQKGIDEGTARLDLYERRTPMRRLGSVKEIAEAVYWSASDEASYVVAETMIVDGGWTAYQLF
ncbi:MAG: SDR family oxidoreductase [Anaerolineales bacterium]|nr:SDR family oxidoreductase [Anaerolineales bacterium]